MTKDELLKLRRERSKQELNIGDKVIAHSASDKPMYDGKVATIIEKGICGNEVYYGLYVPGETKEKRTTPLIGKPSTIGETAFFAPFYAEDLELVKEPTENKPTDEIKVGDRVKFKSKEELETMLEPSFWWGIPLLADKEAEIINIPFEDNYRVDIDPSLAGIRREFFDKITDKTDEQPTEKESRTLWGKEFDGYKAGNSGSHSGTITIPVKAELDDTYWEAYRAELASKIAVAYAEKGRYEPSEIGKLAVTVANGVVDNLKKQGE